MIRTGSCRRPDETTPKPLGTTEKRPGHAAQVRPGVQSIIGLMCPRLETIRAFIGAPLVVEAVITTNRTPRKPSCCNGRLARHQEGLYPR